MFKSFQNTSRTNGFNGFPALNFQMNNEAYGFSGCTFWLDAAYGTNTVTDAAAISLWQTKIGGLIFTQATVASQPSYVAADVSFNNYPTINTSTNRWMSNNFGITLNANSTIAFVAKYDSLFGNILLGTGPNPGQTTMVSLGGSIAGYTGVGWRNSSGTWFTSTVEDANAKIGIISLNDIIVNGANVFNNNSNTVFPELVMQYIALGAQNGYLNGRIAEIIIYNFKMTSNQMIDLSNRLNSKYAIY